MSIESMMPSNHRILGCPLLLLPSIFPSIRVFSNESVLVTRWPKYWSFSFSISPYNEFLGLISFRIDWFDLLAVQGMLKSLLQRHSSKASILPCSAFFMVQLNFVHDYWENHKFVSKVMSFFLLFFNMLSRFAIVFLPRSRCLLSSRQVLGPGALGKPRGNGWRGRWEGGLGWGTHVNPWLFHFNV